MARHQEDHCETPPFVKVEQFCVSARRTELVRVTGAAGSSVYLHWFPGNDLPRPGADHSTDRHCHLEGQEDVQQIPVLLHVGRVSEAELNRLGRTSIGQCEGLVMDSNRCSCYCWCLHLGIYF